MDEGMAMAFGNKNKEPKAPKPVSERKCPHFFASSAGGGVGGPCVQSICAFWQDDVEMCAINVIAQAAKK